MNAPLLNEHKTKLMRHLGEVNIDQIQEKLRCLDDEFWISANEHKPNKFAALQSTQHIVLRFVSSYDDWKSSYDLPHLDQWKTMLYPVLDKATEQYGIQNGQYSRIMFAKLPAGCKIKRHIDAAPAAKYPFKIHIPVITNDRSIFCFDGHSYHFKEGNAYEVNNNIYHWAENNGDTDRVHLIFEYF